MFSTRKIENGLYNPSQAKVPIRYVEISFMINPSVQICGFIYMRRLRKGYIYILVPHAVEYSHATR